MNVILFVIVCDVLLGGVICFVIIDGKGCECKML